MSDSDGRLGVSVKELSVSERGGKSDVWERGGKSGVWERGEDGVSVCTRGNGGSSGGLGKGGSSEKDGSGGNSGGVGFSGIVIVGALFFCEEATLFDSCRLIGIPTLVSVFELEAGKFGRVGGCSEKKSGSFCASF